MDTNFLDGFRWDGNAISRVRWESTCMPGELGVVGWNVMGELIFLSGDTFAIVEIVNNKQICRPSDHA